MDTQLKAIKNLSESQKKLVSVIIDNFDTEKNLIEIDTLCNILNDTQGVSTRSKVSSPKLKAIFTYHTKASVGTDGKAHLTLNDNFTLDFIKDNLTTKETKQETNN